MQSNLHLTKSCTSAADPKVHLRFTNLLCEFLAVVVAVGVVVAVVHVFLVIAALVVEITEEEGQ